MSDAARVPSAGRSRVAAGIAFAFLALGTVAGAEPSLPEQRPVIDSYGGTQVSDPFRYMESETDAAYVTWRDAQVAATRAYLAAIPGRAGLEGELRGALRSPSVDFLTLAAGSAFFMRTASDGSTRIFVRELRGGAERVVADSRELVDGAGLHGSLGAFAASPDGKLLAFHAYLPPMDRSEIRIVRVSDGQALEAPLHDSIYDSLGWTPDGTRVVYDRTFAPASANRAQQAARNAALLHRLGTPQSSDVDVLGYGARSTLAVPPRDFVFLDTQLGSRFALAEIRDPAGIGSRFYVALQGDLGKPDIVWRALGTAADRFTDYAVHGDWIDLASPRDAPNYRVVRARLDRPFAPRVVLPASDTVVVSGTLDGIPKAGIFALNAAADADYVQVLDRGSARMLRIPYATAPEAHDVPLPLRGSILAIATEQDRPGAAVDLTSWTQSGDVYVFEPARNSLQPTELKSRNTWPDGDMPARDDAPRALRVRPPSAHFVPLPLPRAADELSAVAPDGTHVPVSVVHRPGIALDGSHPLLLQVIGAYGFSTTPAYDVVPDAWLSRGGVFAVAHVRGGGELGERWHLAGKNARKPNTWNDLIAAAQLLVAKGYTSPSKLDLYGPSASYLGGIGSGIAVGRAITERPDLFAAAAVDAPTFDMLRSETSESGAQSVLEFGSVNDAGGFASLFAMSPYEHVRANVTYPVLLARSFSQHAVGVDWGAAKMVARLQAAAGLASAAYLDVPNANPDDRRDRVALTADLYAFLLHADGVAGF